MAYNNGSATSRGVAMLVGEAAGITWRKVFADSNGRVLIVDVCAKLWEGRVIIVYAPNDEVERKALFTSLAAWVIPNTLMVGDFNVIQGLDDVGERENLKNDVSRKVKSMILYFADECDDDAGVLDRQDKDEFKNMLAHDQTLFSVGEDGTLNFEF
ncbi:hypothetical protein ABVT39_019436 [Epinephelus coioides]